jgi:predicted nicotinamide N-methyase
VSDYLERNVDRLVTDKDILELGAGAGVPSLVAALRGAKTVVTTDYPEPALVANLKSNVEMLMVENKVKGSVYAEVRSCNQRQKALVANDHPI